MSNIFFSSDTHLQHANIIQYSNRPFANVDEMNEALVENHNKKVKPNDIWIFLGDFCFGDKTKIPYWMNRFNGKKRIIPGNHDRLEWFHEAIKHGADIEWIRDMWFGKIGKTTFHLCHYPIQSWNAAHHGSVHLHGHSHGHTPSPDLLRFDVGVDCTNYAPLSLEEVETMVKTKRQKLDPDNLDPHRKGHHQ
jgi:calcineurin-like phosphoesterase family protein